MSIKLTDLKGNEVPEELRIEYYFDFSAHPFRHQDLFGNEGSAGVVEVLSEIHGYIEGWLSKTIGEKKGLEKVISVGERDGKVPCCYGRFTAFIEPGATFNPRFIQGGEGGGCTLYVSRGAKVLGADIWLDGGDIFIGEDTVIEPGVGLKGPAIIGKQNEIRQGAYFRGDVLTGDRGTFRGELKNVVMMDEANFPHPSYVGDSICGYKTHFGNGATTANLGIYALVTGKENIKINLKNRLYDLGRTKMGIVLGDYSQVGCNSTSDPGTFLAPRTIVYQLSRINKGFYGPNEILKNKPLEHGVIERVPLKEKGGDYCKGGRVDKEI